MHDQPDITADEALQRLIDGNERFLRGESRVAGLSREAVAGLDPGLPPPVRLAWAIESNVRSTACRILESPEGQARVAEGRVKCVGAVYEIETGRVRILEAPGLASG